MMNADNLTAVAQVRIRRPPAEVYHAFANADAMSKFWFTRRDEGLKAGEPVTWFLGSEEGAYSFSVRVKELRRPNRIVIEWENGGSYTQVTWTIEETGEGDSILRIEESGFSGSPEEIVERALDSTGGFNQVIIAAKALIEHGVGLNVLSDHA